MDTAALSITSQDDLMDLRLTPATLQPGDEVRVIAPACSLAIIGQESRTIADRRFDELGLRLSFGRHLETCDEFESSPIEDRIADLHEAFEDPNVSAIMTVIGGYNSNQLLPYIDWDLLRANPKIFCGYSDITALSCSILAKTGMVTFSGPHYSTFGMEQHLDQTLNWFASALMTSEPLVVGPSATWSDDAWYLDQQDRVIESNDGFWLMHEGAAEGTLVGGNLCTFNLLHGTEYMPDLAGTIVFIEDDFESMPHTFDRDLTSLTQQAGFDGVRALLIGRFQRASGMKRSTLDAIIKANHRLAGLPILANMDFGHTDPLLTLPVGGVASLEATSESSRLIVAHQRGVDQNQSMA